MAFISGGQITGDFGSWGTYRIRYVDFGETRGPLVDVSGTDSVLYRDTLTPDLADLNDVEVGHVFDDERIGAPVAPVHSTPESNVTLTIGNGATIVGIGQGLASRTGRFEINQAVIAAFIFRWKDAPVWSPAGP